MLVLGNKRNVFRRLELLLRQITILRSLFNDVMSIASRNGTIARAINEVSELLRRILVGQDIIDLALKPRRLQQLMD